MNGGNFDHLTRTIGRRGLLGGLLALAAGGVARPAAEAQEAGACPEGCPAGEVCVDGYCQQTCVADADCAVAGDVCIGAQCFEGFCSVFIVDCIPGYSCCGNGECCPNPCTTDAECASPLLCTTGFCGAAGVCEFVEIESCVICESDIDCVVAGERTTCCGGICAEPCPVGSMQDDQCTCQPEGPLPPMDWPPPGFPLPESAPQWPFPTWPPLS